MQRGRTKDRLTILPPVTKGHYFISFCEEYWGNNDVMCGRIEIYRPGDEYDWQELRWFFYITEGMCASFDLFREYWDFTNITERELQRLQEQLKFFQEESHE